MKIGFQLRTTAGQARRACGLFSFVFLASSLGLIAEGFGSISRTISDSTGAALPSVTVTATQTKTGSRMVVESNDSGAVFPTLPPAEYAIATPETGFQGYLQNGIVLLANRAASVNITLNLVPGANHKSGLRSAWH